MKGKIIWVRKREYDEDGNMYKLEDHEWSFEIDEPDYNIGLYDMCVIFELEDQMKFTSIEKMKKKWCPFSRVTEITQLDDNQGRTQLLTSVNRPVYDPLPKCIANECIAFELGGDSNGICLLLK